MKSKKVLYCGMADDVLSPLLLVPDLTHLYVIDEFDNAFARRISEKKSGTWETQKKDIKTMLSNGNDNDSHHLDIYREYKGTWPITKLEEPCTLLEETDSNKRWHLAFKYKGIKRELIYIHHTNFYSIWPSEINDISHVMSMGAVFIVEKNGEFKREEKDFLKMLAERTTTDCLYYDQYNLFDIQYNLYDHKKGYTTKTVRNTKIIISKLENELNR